MDYDPKCLFFPFERALRSQRVKSGFQVSKGSESRSETAFGAWFAHLWTGPTSSSSRSVVTEGIRVIRHLLQRQLLLRWYLRWQRVRARVYHLDFWFMVVKGFSGRVRVRVGVRFNISVCHRSKCHTVQVRPQTSMHNNSSFLYALFPWGPRRLQHIITPVIGFISMPHLQCTISTPQGAFLAWYSSLW